MAKRWSESDRVAWVRQWRASGLSCARFASRHGLLAATLYAWSHRVGREAATLARAGEARRGAQFTQVRVVGAVSLSSSGGGAIEVVVGEGRVVRVLGAVNESQLRTVLRVVSEC